MTSVSKREFYRWLNLAALPVKAGWNIIHSTPRWRIRFVKLCYFSDFSFRWKRSLCEQDIVNYMLIWWWKHLVLSSV